MKRAFLATVAVVLALLCAACGIKLNSPTNPSYDPVLPGADKEDDDEKAKSAETTSEDTAPPKISKYFDVFVEETESGILYLPYVDEDGNETEDIVVVGYNGTSFKVVIPPIIAGGNVIAIGDGAFFGRPNITSIELPDSVTEIGRAAFSSMPSLRSIKFGSGITELPEAVLRNCRVLAEVMLPDTLEVIGDFAFEGCLMLETLYIPASVREIGHDAFMTCERLTLDVSDNEYAAEYAKNNNVNIDYDLSYATFRKRVLIALGIGAAIAAVSIGIYLYMRYRKEMDAW